VETVRRENGKEKRLSQRRRRGDAEGAEKRGSGEEGGLKPPLRG